MNESEIPTPLFVGFFPKQTMDANGTLAPYGVVDVGAVSNCISSPPDDWIEHWEHNDSGFFDTEELAISIVPSTKRALYDVYAYELFPVRYANTLESFEVVQTKGRVPADFDFLGYDVVTRSVAAFFECSPLSCNAAASTFAVNEHCLVHRLAEAWSVFLEIGRSEVEYEPGPYYLFAVYRKRRATRGRGSFSSSPGRRL